MVSQNFSKIYDASLLKVVFLNGYEFSRIFFCQKDCKIFHFQYKQYQSYIPFPGLSQCIHYVHKTKPLSSSSS